MTRPHADAESECALHDYREGRIRVPAKGIEYFECWCIYDRKARHFLAFLTLAAALTCLEKLTNCAT
ncbi:hypothetical protein [Nocardia beijingensis]|uniref:Uncharacterized protein n=1 Tax=Nocardia beijingensis TaxID=95162 RepID=A0ABW7WJW6_9NOCA